MTVNKNEIIDLTAKIFECDINTISEETGLGHHPNWDSLGHISLMVALEEKYHITIDENNIEKLLTIANIIRYINES